MSFGCFHSAPAWSDGSSLSLNQLLNTSACLLKGGTLDGSHCTETYFILWNKKKMIKNPSNAKTKLGPKLQNTSVSIRYFYISDHMLTLNSFSNSVTFPNIWYACRLREKNLHKYLQTVFHPGLGMISVNADGATQWVQLHLKMYRLPSFLLCILMICGASGSQECDCVHLCQHT